jgi:hypothetical protein
LSSSLSPFDWVRSMSRKRSVDISMKSERSGMVIFVRAK